MSLAVASQPTAAGADGTEAKRRVPSRKKRFEAQHINLLNVTIAPMVHGMRVNLGKEGESGDGDDNDIEKSSNTKMQLTQSAGQHLNEVANIMLNNILDKATELVKRDGRRNLSERDVRTTFAILCEPEVLERITTRQNTLLEHLEANKSQK